MGSPLVPAWLHAPAALPIAAASFLQTDPLALNLDENSMACTALAARPAIPRYARLFASLGLLFAV